MNDEEIRIKVSLPIIEQVGKDFLIKEHVLNQQLWWKTILFEGINNAVDLARADQDLKSRADERQKIKDYVLMKAYIFYQATQKAVMPYKIEEWINEALAQSEINQEVKE